MVFSISFSDAKVVLVLSQWIFWEFPVFSTANIGLINDRTPMEKKNFDNLKCKLRERSTKREKNLTIKSFRNEMPVILIKSNPKDDLQPHDTLLVMLQV